MNYTINEIPDEAVELSGNEMIPIWQGETKKVSVATLAWYVQDATSYSTTETLTGGKWIDGKPIYRKVFQNNSTSLQNNLWISTPTIFPDIVNFNIDRIVTSNLFFVSDSRNELLNVHDLAISVNWMYINDITPKPNSKVELVLEYTKTTD